MAKLVSAKARETTKKPSKGWIVGACQVPLFGINEVTPPGSTNTNNPERGFVVFRAWRNSISWIS
jgi:hypothetical protein